MDIIKDAFKDIDKKMLLIIGGGILGIVLLILVITLIARANFQSFSSYETVEQNLITAAESYYADNSSFLPSAIKTTTVVNDKTLSNNGYIKPLDELLKDGDTCEAQVVVTKTSAGYDYTPYLECDNYTSVELYSKVLEDNTVVSSGAGLYQMNNEYVFRGEAKNNYVLLNEKLWRIVRIDEDNNVVLISNFKTEPYTWDDRYNEETSSSTGINDYNVSRIKDTLESVYYGEELLTESERSKVTPTKLCIGSRNVADSLSRDVECKTLSDTESFIGLLTVSEYLNASIDPNCKTLEDRSCINYNYLNEFTSTFWSITPGIKNSSYVYNITTSGVAESRANISKQVRYVINLGTKAIYTEGSGIETNPYKIR